MRISLSGDFLQQAASVRFTRPNFRQLDRSLFARAEFQRSDTDAFSGYEGLVAAGLSWTLSERWRTSVGGGLEFSSL